MQNTLALIAKCICPSFKMDLFEFENGRFQKRISEKSIVVRKVDFTI